MQTRSPRLLAVACAPGAIACAATLAFAIAAPGLAARPVVQWAPWAVGLLAFGIPHGALDHRVGAGGSARLGFVAGYLVLAAAVLAAWWVAPMAALVGFLAVAAFHFGQGDLYWARAAREGIGPVGELGGGRARRWPGWRSAAMLAARGVVPVALPVLVFADEFAAAADAMAGRLFGGTARWELPGATRAAGLAIVLGIAAAHVALLAAEAPRRPDRRRVAAGEAAGTALLVALFSTVPPVLAMGVYFNAWHSVRHVARLLPVAGPTREAARAGRWAEALARFHVATLPTTLAALAMTAALWWALRARVGSAADLGLAALAMVSALTLPHVLVVLGMDRSQMVRGRRTAGEARP